MTTHLDRLLKSFMTIDIDSNHSRIETQTVSLQDIGFTKDVEDGLAKWGARHGLVRTDEKEHCVRWNPDCLLRGLRMHIRTYGYEDLPRASVKWAIQEAQKIRGE